MYEQVRVLLIKYSGVYIVQCAYKSSGVAQESLLFEQFAHHCLPAIDTKMY